MLLRPIDEVLKAYVAGWRAGATHEEEFNARGEHKEQLVCADSM